MTLTAANLDSARAFIRTARRSLDRAEELLMGFAQPEPVAVRAAPRPAPPPGQVKFDDVTFCRMWADGAMLRTIADHFGWKSLNSVYNMQKKLQLPARNFVPGRKDASGARPAGSQRRPGPGAITGPITAPLRPAPRDHHPRLREDGGRRSERPEPVTDHISPVRIPDAGTVSIDTVYGFLRQQDTDLVPIGSRMWLLNGRRKVTAEELIEIANRKRVLIGKPAFVLENSHG